MVIKPAVGVVDFASNVSEGQLSCIYTNKCSLETQGSAIPLQCLTPQPKTGSGRCVLRPRLFAELITSSSLDMSHSIVCSEHTPRGKLLAKHGCAKSIEDISNGISMLPTLVSQGVNRTPYLINQTYLRFRPRDPRWRQRHPSDDFSYYIVLLGQAPVGLVP